VIPAQTVKSLIAILTFILQEIEYYFFLAYENIHSLNKVRISLLSAMFNSWFHIERLAREIAVRIGSAICGQPFTYQKNDLHIPLEKAGDWRDIHFCRQAPLPFLTLETVLPQPKHKVAVFAELFGKTITSVNCRRDDRQILIVLNDGEFRLLFRLYGINGNVFLLDRDGRVADVFKKPKQDIEIDEKYFMVTNRIFPSQAETVQLAADFPDQTLAVFLQKTIRPPLPKVLIGEITARAGLNLKELIVNINAMQMAALTSALNELENHFKTQNPRIYGGARPVFSLVELRSFADRAAVEYDSVLTAQNQYIRDYLNDHRLTERKNSLLRQVELLLAAAQRKLINQQNDLAALPTAATYREWADTLMTNAHQIPIHSSKAILPRLAGNADEITIPLDPKISPIENAQRYYAKARQINASRTELARRIDETAGQIRQYENALRDVAAATEFKQLRSLAVTLPQPLRAVSTPEAVRLPFQRFVLDGWEILVGKNARDNDELTRKIARPADFWFHAQGTTGSHVVVRNPGKTTALPGVIRTKVAGLAAFFSKAKHSTVVPVIFTQCRFVTKPRRAAPGEVAVRNEKSLLVEPLDPKKLT